MNFDNILRTMVLLIWAMVIFCFFALTISLARLRYKLTLYQAYYHSTERLLDTIEDELVELDTDSVTLNYSIMNSPIGIEYMENRDKLNR